MDNDCYEREEDLSTMSNIIHLMPMIWIDGGAKELLAQTRERIKEDGIIQPTYGDAVRRLARMSGKKEESPLTGA